MINHYLIQKALRTKLLELEVVTTGSTSISATSTGYARAAGSFLADGFVAGLEVTGTGFSNSANNTAKTVTSVTAAAMVCSGTTTEAAGSRTIAVNLPLNRAWENVELQKTRGEPWIQEEYIPGPMSKETLGPLGQLEVLPLYVLKIYVPSGMGIGAARSYADALITLFAPSTAISIVTGMLLLETGDDLLQETGDFIILESGGDTARVRNDVSPFAGQLLQDVIPGFATVPISVPLRMRTANSI